MRLCRYLILVLFVVSSASCTPTSAQTTEAEVGGMSKVAPELAALYNEYSSYLASHKAGVFRSNNPLVRVIDDRVVVDAVASGDVNTLKSDLMSLGMQQPVAFGRIVSGQLPISAIPGMTALPSLNFARAASALLQGGPEPRSP